MGILTEYNPDLALRAFGTAGRLESECFPRDLVPGEVHTFWKNGRRNYYLEGEIPLVETKGNQELSDPVASIIILEEIHFIQEKQHYTQGRYKIVEVFNDGRVHFNGFKKIEVEHAVD